MSDPNCLDCHNHSRQVCAVHADSDAADLEIARLKAELQAFKEERALGPVVVRTETPTAAMKELERLCNEARDLADANAAKHAKAKKCWMEALDAVQEARAELSRLEEEKRVLLRLLRATTEFRDHDLSECRLSWTLNAEHCAACRLNKEIEQALSSGDSE